MNWLYYLFTASLLFSSNQIPGLDQKRPILLKGGTIHTMTGDILEDMTYCLLKERSYRLMKRFNLPLKPMFMTFMKNTLSQDILQPTQG